MIFTELSRPREERDVGGRAGRNGDDRPIKNGREPRDLRDSSDLRESKGWDDFGSEIPPKPDARDESKHERVEGGSSDRSDEPKAKVPPPGGRLVKLRTPVNNFE